MRTLMVSLVCLAVLSAAASRDAAAELYRWVDDDGNVHYTDSLPPERARDGRRVFSSTGVTREDIEAAPTEEERRALQEERRRQQEALAEQQRRREEQAAYDRLLLRTYTSVEDIREARENRIQALDRSRQLIRNRLQRDSEELDAVRRQAATAERSGRSGDLDMLYSRIDRLQERIRAGRNDIADLDDEEDRLTEEFNAQADRYRELEQESRAR